MYRLMGIPPSAIFAPKKALSKNNRYYAVVDRHSNIAVIKARYHANLYGEPRLHKRALADIPSYLCTYYNQSVIYIKTLRNNVLEDYYIVQSFEYPTFMITSLSPTGVDRPASKQQQ